MGKMRNPWGIRIPVRDPVNAPEGPGVYFLQCAHSLLVKIGVAENIRKRVVDIAQASPTPVIFLGAVKADRELESALHRKFVADQDHGEWFAPSDALVNELRQRGCQPLLKIRAPAWLSFLRQTWDGYAWTEGRLSEFTELRRALLTQSQRVGRSPGWLAQAQKRLTEAEELQRRVAELVERCRADLEGKAATHAADTERRRSMRQLRREYQSLSPEELERRIRDAMQRLADGVGNGSKPTPARMRGDLG